MQHDRVRSILIGSTCFNIHSIKCALSICCNSGRSQCCSMAGIRRFSREDVECCSLRSSKQFAQRQLDMEGLSSILLKLQFADLQLDLRVYRGRSRLSKMPLDW